MIAPFALPLPRISTALAALLVAFSCAAPASAKEAVGQNYQPPRTADGKPSLQGTWSNSSITRLQRSSQYEQLIISPEQVAELTGAHPQVVRQKTDDNLDPQEGLLDGSDLGMGRGYNAFWIDPGKEFGLVKGTRRSSWIVEPADGRIPFSKQGQALRGSERGDREESAGPEARSLGERCMIGFGGTGGPPMLNTLYNNTYQIVQTPEHVMVLVEMVHDARIIPIVEGPKAKENAFGPVDRWLGESVGWWEEDTLVVETRNWQPQQAEQGPVYISEQGRVIERFSRYSDAQILYQFEVHDPVYYSRPWRGEMSFNATEGPVYEYACHEGNLGIVGILQGARAKERQEGAN